MGSSFIGIWNRMDDSVGSIGTECTDVARSFRHLSLGSGWRSSSFLLGATRASQEAEAGRILSEGMTYKSSMDEGPLQSLPRPCSVRFSLGKQLPKENEEAEE